MKTCVVLTLLLAVGYVHAQGVTVEVDRPVGQGIVQILLRGPTVQGPIEQGSCQDAAALGAAKEALNKINRHRQEGYIFSLHRLSNVHTVKHGQTGAVFYLTMDVEETACSVLSKKNYTTCEARDDSDTPVYGKCRAAIYMNRPHRAVRLYKYDCTIRPVPSRRVSRLCPDCPTVTDLSNAQVQKAVVLSLEKFNKEGGQANRFALVNISRARASWMFMSMSYYVEYIIQETICANTTQDVTNCPLKDSKLARKGFCKGSYLHGLEEAKIDCDIYEPEAAETVNDHITKGMVRVLPAMGSDVPMTLPSFPDVPASGPEDAVTLPLKQDPQIPGHTEPTIQAYPTSVSAQCPPPAPEPTPTSTRRPLVKELLAEDPMFKEAA